jgi:hypothetical protein
MHTNMFLGNLAKTLKDHKYPGLRVMIIGPETNEVKAAMEKTQTILRESEIKVWALTDLLPGMDRSLFLEYGSSEADLVFVFVSSEIEDDGQHHLFISKAFAAKGEKSEGTIFIIPIVLEDCDVPRRLRELEPINAASKASVASLISTLDSKKKKIKVLANPKITWK